MNIIFDRIIIVPEGYQWSPEYGLVNIILYICGGFLERLKLCFLLSVSVGTSLYIRDISSWIMYHLVVVLIVSWSFIHIYLAAVSRSTLI